MWRIEVELDKLQLSQDILEQTFATLSPGEQTKVLLAVLFVDERGFQLIDEPTNHLDIEGRQIVADYLKRKTGFIVISHDKSFINPVVDHVISINRQDITVFKGNFDTWQIAMDQQNQREALEKRQLQKDVQRLHKTAVARKNWAVKSDQQNPDSTGKKMMKKSQVVMHRVDVAITEKQKLLHNLEIDDPISFNYQPTGHVDELLAVDNLILSKGTVTTPMVSFSLKKGQVVSLLGSNGIGKTTIFKKILGLNPTFTQSGTISLANKLKISYLAQDKQLVGTIEQLAVDKKIPVEAVYGNLRKLGFERNLFTQPVEQMSQGQRQKVALAISLTEPADIYFWDEPLNYLDVITRQQIIVSIKKQHPTMLLIDHDIDLIDEISTEKVDLHY